MKTTVAFKAISNMLFSVMLLMPLQLNIQDSNFGFNLNMKDTSIEVDEVPPSAMPKVVLLEEKENYCDIDCYLEDNKDTITFISKTFAIDENVVYSNLKEINKDQDYIENNIGRLKNKDGELKEYNSFEKGLIEYLFDLSDKSPKLFSKKRVAYDGDSEYVIDLIKYFTDIYDNVDYLTAVSIGAAESGYYKVKYMLNCNNVFGGMGSNGLIKYKNIEYGILSYIRLLSRNYYGKGLDTLDEIGRIYCPTYNENGVKVASSHWKGLVNKAKQKYKNSYTEVTVANLLND